VNALSLGLFAAALAITSCSATAAGQLVFSNAPAAAPIPVDKVTLKADGSIAVTCKLTGLACPGIDAIPPAPTLAVVSIPAAGGNVFMSWSVSNAAICQARTRVGSAPAPWWTANQFTASGSASLGPVSAGTYQLDLLCYSATPAVQSSIVTFQVQ
jgi:hypothetical protein